MSLINEALKKAQRQRNLEATPTASAPSGIAAAAVTTHVRTASHRSSQAPLWFGLGLLLLGGVVTAVVILFVLKPTPAPATSTAAVQPAVSIAAATPKPPAPAPAPTPMPEAPLPTITVPSMSAPVAATPTPAPAPVPAVVVAPPAPPPAAPVTITIPATPAPPVAPVTVAATKPSPAHAVTVAVVPPSPPPVAPVTVTRVSVTQESKVYAVIDKLRITGVRGTGSEARVLMNEKVYRINDLVDRDLGLRLTEVSSSQLGFVDASGQSYKKQL